MTSERIQRRIEALPDEADQAILAEDWAIVGARGRLGAHSYLHQVIAKQEILKA